MRGGKEVQRYEGAKVRRCEGAKVRRCEGAKVRRCEGAKARRREGAQAQRARRTRRTRRTQGRPQPAHPRHGQPRMRRRSRSRRRSRNRQFSLAFHLAQRQRRFDRRDAGQHAQRLAQERAVVVEIVRDHLQQIVGGPRHVVARQDARNAEHLALEAVRDAAIVNRAAQQHERDDAEAKRVARELRAIAFDVAVAFEAFEPARARRFAQAHRIGEAGDGDAAVELHCGENGAVGFVEFDHVVGKL
ncbi:hypothetical protein DO73_5180 [Burkholderia pseudomallei]|nr:hypothetical protein DO73_5180 [Burkholderia pseudomallei]